MGPRVEMMPWSQLWLLGLALALFSGEALASDPQPLEFNRDIRPILSENCFLCHGPDKSHRKAGLRLDDRQAALAKEAFVPGQADASELIARIVSPDPDEVMPPPESTKALTPSQKDLLRRWVAEGARYQAHWAYEPIKKPVVPSVQNAGWVRSLVDAFVLATLEARGLKPSIEADRRTLIRRLSLDLVGLPPTPEEVRAFEADTSLDAYERVVDRLLTSPHYGERMAIPWLDLARFADTVGYHGDQNQHVFPYRDYVVNAFNRNLPFDQFTREQLAGDLLPDPTPEQRVATGFNRLNMVTREGGAQPGEYLAKYASDRVRTVAITWLGSTMGCAECHDHKYDPFLARDFYQMAAFFGDVKQWGVYADYGYTPNPDLRGVGNDHPFPPEVAVDSPYLRNRMNRLDLSMTALWTAAADGLKNDPDRQAGFDVWLGEVRGFVSKNPTGWSTPPALVEADPQTESPGTLQGDGSLRIEPKAKSKDGLKIRLNPEAGWLASIRLEVLPLEEAGSKILRKGAANPTITLSCLVRSASGKTRKLAIAHADADHKEERYSSGSAILGVKDGWRLGSRDSGSKQAAVYLLEDPVKLVEGDQVVVTLKAEGVACVRLSLSPLAVEDPRSDAINPALIESMARVDPDTPPPAPLIRAYLLGTDADPARRSDAHRMALERRECRGGKALSLTTEAREPIATRVLARGNWQDESGELVPPGVPSFLPQPPEARTRRLNRLDLARWLTSTENPLTARVFANRVWKQLFGTGLSAVMEDLGAQGEAPSHPELLDWLASEFRDGGWDVKALVKRMVMSNTYRQDARLRPELREVDPNNRLLTSQNPRRLEAEFVRDNALAISGLLNLDLGGPSVKPYQPPGYYAILQFPDRDYLADRDDRQYRRGIYTHWQRTFLQPMMANFDAPSREECTASRVAANTPQQALTLLNDPTFVEAARALAGSILTPTDKSDEARLDRLFERALARPARAKERASLLAFLTRQRSETRDHPAETAKLLRVGIAANPPGVKLEELAAWTEVCRVVLNLHETITRY